MSSNHIHRLSCTPECSTTQCRGQHVYANLQVPKKIHVLGTGSVGKLIAHSIRGVVDPPPVTLLYHRPTFEAEFEKAGRILKIKTGRHEEERSGFESELVLPIRRDLGRSHEIPLDRERFQRRKDEEPIYNLIVTVKAQDTVSALAPIAHRLNPESTILFLQNGMGIIEECNEKLFPDLSTRPNYIAGVNSHGVHATSAFSATHAGHGTIMLGILPRKPLADRDEDRTTMDVWSDSSRYLLRALSRIPVLAAVPLAPTDLLQAQYEKLAVNCVINPLTAMMDCRNGALLNNFAVSRTMVLLLAEISLVIQSLPELREIPNVKLRFSPERLQHLVVNVASTTGENISSMLQDMRRGMRTEIDYINGYIVKKGEAIGIKPVMNYMLMQMVIGKQQMISREVDGYSPLLNNPRSGEDASEEAGEEISG